MSDRIRSCTTTLEDILVSAEQCRADMFLRGGGGGVVEIIGVKVMALM